MIRPLIFATVCACALASRGNDDETHFKAKTYEPSRSLSDRTYHESAYTPSRPSSSEGKRLEAPGTPGRWRLFDRGEKLTATRQLADAPADHETAYKQEKQISVPTLKSDPRDVPEQKPFKETVKNLSDASFKSKEASREKNPLLAPRQGIKAPE